MRTFLYLATAFLFLTTSLSSYASESLILRMPKGKVTILLLPDLAPHHVEQVKTLTKTGFYDGLAWFRVIRGFMAQTGYPLEANSDKHWGKRGKSDLPDLPDEFSKHTFRRGTVGMGHSAEPNSANSQFFICLTDEGCTGFAGKYTAWGQVTSGMEIVDSLPLGEPPANPERILEAKIIK